MPILQKLAAVAKGLTKAELHVLLELAARAEEEAAHGVKASSRELARRTGLARASIQTALDSLNSMGVLISEASVTGRCLTHRLKLAQQRTEVGDEAQNLGQAGLVADPSVAQTLGHGGLTIRPEVAQNSGHGGLRVEPGVAQVLDHAGPEPGPGAIEESVACVATHKGNARVRTDSIENDFDKTIHRLQKTTKSDFDPKLFEHVRSQIAGHHAKFARPENRLSTPPDDRITAQFLAIAEWPRLERLLADLAAERKEAGHSYAWYVTVALQRIHGISPERLREFRNRQRRGKEHGNEVDQCQGLARQHKPGNSSVGAALKLGPSIETGPKGNSFGVQIRALAIAKSMR